MTLGSVPTASNLPSALARPVFAPEQACRKDITQAFTSTQPPKQSSFSRRIAHHFASNRAYFSVCYLSYRCATGCDVARAIAARSARFDTGFQDDARTTEPHDCAARAAADGAHVRCARAEYVRLRHDCEELVRRRRHRDRRGRVLQARGGQGRRAHAHAHYH